MKFLIAIAVISVSLFASQAQAACSDNFLDGLGCMLGMANNPALEQLATTCATPGSGFHKCFSAKPCLLASIGPQLLDQQSKSQIDQCYELYGSTETGSFSGSQGHGIGFRSRRAPEGIRQCIPTSLERICIFGQIWQNRQLQQELFALRGRAQACKASIPDYCIPKSDDLRECLCTATENLRSVIQRSIQSCDLPNAHAAGQMFEHCEILEA